jgi:hypothetical protein
MSCSFFDTANSECAQQYIPTATDLYMHELQL